MAEEKEDCGKTEIKAKDVSIWGKILVTVFIVAVSILKWTGVFRDVDMRDVTIAGIAMYLPFSTIDFNLMLEKIFHRSEK